MPEEEGPSGRGGRPEKRGGFRGRGRGARTAEGQRGGRQGPSNEEEEVKMVPPQFQKEVSMEFGEQEEEKKGGPVRSENGS